MAVLPCPKYLDPANLRGSLLVWKEPHQQWRPISYTAPLTSSIYLPVGITVGLSKFVITTTRNAREAAQRRAAVDYLPVNVTFA